MINILLGLLVISIVFVMVLIWSRGERSILLPLLISLVIGFCLSITQAFFFILPQGGSDAVTFERVAWEWGQDGFRVALSNYTGASSYFLSWLISLFYGALDRSQFAAQNISIAFNLGSVLFCYKLALLLWGESVARRAIWVAALFPVLLLHSALILRESYVSFFFVAGSYFLAKWVITKRNIFFLSSFASFSAATFFHGGMVFSIVGFFLYFSFSLVKSSASSFKPSNASSLSSVVTGVAVLVVVCAVIVAGINVPKVGDVSRFTDEGHAESAFIERAVRARGDAAHPSWTLINSNREILPKLPIRVSYFLFSPFPWDVRSPSHLIGLIDSLFYIFLFFFLVKARGAVINNKPALAVAVVLMVCLVVFSMGVTNFGTGIRHRAKFVPVLIALAAIMIPSFRVLNRSVRHPERAS